MKTMTCKQLGGPCEKEFHAKTYEEMVKKSKNHGMEMFQKEDEEHIKVMTQMKEKMKSQSSEEMKAWFKNRRKGFDRLPDNS